MTKEKKKFDKIWIGVTLGIIVPLIAFYFFFVFQDVNMTFQSYWEYLISNSLTTKVLSVSLVANLAVFYLFIHTEKYFSAKGVIGSTIFYALGAMIYILFF